MAKLTTNHCVFWFGTGASIPAAFARHNIGATARFLSGAPASTDPGSTGGSLTHTHAIADHNHTAADHTHQFSSDSIAHATTCSDPASGGATLVAHHTHAHPATASSGISTTLTWDNATGLTTAASSSGATTPLYIEALLIKPSSDGEDVPANACVLFESATAPSGYSKADGAASTPNVDGRFIRIAANATTDGGATGGTSADHNHGSGSSHTHTFPGTTAHGHAAIACANADATVAWTAGAAPLQALVLAHHNISLDTGSSDTLANSSITVNDSGLTNFSPRRITLATMQNTSGGGSTPDGIIVPYIGTLAQLAALSDWQLCDGSGGRPDIRSIQVKSQFTSLGVTDGANTHSHTTAAHSHSATATHTHTVTEDTPAATRGRNTAAGNGLRVTVGDPHAGEHTWTCGTATLTTNTAAPNTEVADHRDPYLEVLWVKYVPVVASTVVSHGQLYAGSVVLAG